MKSDNAAGESEVKSGLKSKQIENHEDVLPIHSENHEGASVSYAEKNPLETNDCHIDQNLISVKKG